MAEKAVKEKAVSIKLACQAFAVSESCYRYVAKLRDENELIAHWLLKLTDNHRSWGFGLCYLYLLSIVATIRPLHCHHLQATQLPN
jgi:putative transposase